MTLPREPGTVRAIDVAVGATPYRVHVGAGLVERADEFLRPPPHARRAAVVTSGVPRDQYATALVAALRRLGLSTEVIELPDGEAAKTLDTLRTCYETFAALPLGRDDLVVALGGGVIGDLVGFAAATWNRGVAVVQVPTTLLAQVDAAVGGKTGVNLPAGKNLVGAFHQPLAVLADTDTLDTLPARQVRAGLGEVAKYGYIADPEILTVLREPWGSEVRDDLVRRSVTVKARFVAADEREAGERALLNFGHTIGHAIEALGGYETYLHGEAVALGMVAATRLGEALGRTETGLAARTVALLDDLGLPTGGVRLDPDAVWELMRRDKKARGGVRFVLCERPGRAVLVDQPPTAAVDEALASLA